jgi:succinate dehydrogenase / fumarate reductase iron-sulfur subunit
VAEPLPPVRVKIRRYDPEVDPDANWQVFEVPVEQGDRLIDALHQIKGYQDGSLTFRRSCAHGVCGSDAMRINGVNRLACKVLIKDLGDEILVEPIKGLPVLKDLIVDMEPFFEAYRSVKPFLITDGREPTRERLQSADDRERFDDTTKCIMCAACTTSCPVYWNDEAYFGPQAIVMAHRFIFDSRDDGRRGAARDPQRPRGRVALPHDLQLHRRLPRGIQVTKAIQEVKRALIFRRV